MVISRTASRIFEKSSLKGPPFYVIKEISNDMSLFGPKGHQGSRLPWDQTHLWGAWRNSHALYPEEEEKTTG